MWHVVLMVIAIFFFTILITALAFISGLGKVVESGGNMQKLLSDIFPSTDVESKDKRLEKCETAFRQDRWCQVIRTICGLLFAVLMMCPILYDKKIISLNVVYALSALEIVTFFIMWIYERKYKKQYGRVDK